MTRADKTFWFLWLITAIILSLCIAHGADVPPLPRAWQKSTDVKGATLLLQKRDVRTPRFIMLTWNYHYTTNNPQSQIVFNIRANRSVGFEWPSYAWSIVGITSGTNWTMELDRSAEGITLFTVTASNVMTGMESEFATK